MPTTVPLRARATSVLFQRQDVERPTRVARGLGRMSTPRACTIASRAGSSRCGDACPFIPGKRYIDWDLADPKCRPLDEVRSIRDDIARRVAELVPELG
jgi:hypothetical protein